MANLAVDHQFSYDDQFGLPHLVMAVYLDEETHGHRTGRVCTVHEYYGAYQTYKTAEDLAALAQAPEWSIHYLDEHFSPDVFAQRGY
jgi:hypothetical protein